MVVVIHGGFWKAEYDLSLGRPLAASLVARGWAAWNLEYRRVGNGGGVPATLDDVAAGIDALADVDDLDTSKVIALGHSAGGHLAAWAAARGRFERWQPERVRLTGVVAQAGVLDLRSGVRRAASAAARSKRSSAIRPVPTTTRPTRSGRSRSTYRSGACTAATTTTVPISQSRDYVAAARAAGAAADARGGGGDHYASSTRPPTSGPATLAVLDRL